MDCRACGQKNKAGAKFCAGCGGAIETTREVAGERVDETCDTCGTVFTATGPFCGKCGTPRVLVLEVTANATPPVKAVPLPDGGTGICMP